MPPFLLPVAADRLLRQPRWRTALPFVLGDSLAW